MKHFYNYLNRYKYIFIWTFIFTFVCHGLLLLSDYVGIDTSEAIMTKGSNHYFVCLNMGRQSLVFIKWITDTLLINPYVVGVMSLVFLWFSGILWTYLFSYVANNDSAKAVTFANFIYISCVLFVETFYFKVQCTEFTIDFCLIALSLLWTLYFIDTKKIKYFIGTVLLMLIYMGTYQALTIPYIIGAQILFFLIFFFKKSSYDYKEIWSVILKFIFSFLTGFVLNQIITKVFFSKGNVYYNDLMHWGNDSVSNCIKEIFRYIARVLIGNSIYYPFLFTALMLLVVFIAIGVCIKNKKTGSVLLILDLFFIMLSPSYLSIALGGNVVYRTQLVYPYLTLFIAYFAFVLIDNFNLNIKKILNIVFIAISSFIIFTNLNNCLRLEYTDKMRNKEDSYIAMDLINRIENLQNDDSSIPVYFHGAYERELNPSCIYGESIGKSMFAHDTTVSPAGYYSTIRAIAYISQFGKSYLMINDISKYDLLPDLAADMPAYPKDGSVAIKDGLIIINLSN